MTAKNLANLQSSLSDISKTGEDYTVNGVHVETRFFCDVNRSTTRSLIFMNERNVGFIDYVVPYNIFKEPWEYILLDFITETPWDGQNWQEDPYPKDDEPMTYSPCFKDMEQAVEFFKTYMV